jgi:hypothetical protein
MPPRADFCAVDSGAARHGTWSATSSASRPGHRPVCPGAC